MIHELDGVNLNPEFKNEIINDNDYVLCYNKRAVLLIDNQLPKYKDVEYKNFIYAFSIGDDRFFLCLDTALDATFDVNIFRRYKPENIAFAIITGFHLNTWYSQNKYCGVCGSKMEYGTKERNMVCPSCGHLRFPSIAPAVIVGLLHKDKILLTKYNTGYANYALVAGYNEIGESLEETVKREVFEEVGLHVDNIRYYKSQPWGLSGSLLSGYFADVIDEDITPTLQEDELKEATWFTRDEIDLENDGVSLTREMIFFFKDKEVRVK